MSLLAATQIPKPADEQAFERACVPLWIGLLNDPTVTRNGRRGQRQNGVDLIGMRNGSPAHYVGIQCKLKSDGKGLDEDEVRGEVEKALTFKPALREYYIVTTAPDDVAMQELARIITLQLHEKGTNLLVFVWGWNTLEEKIFQDSKARNAFDPDYGAFSEQILENTDHLLVQQTEISQGLSEISAKMDLLQGRVLSQPGDGTVSVELYEKGLDAEIDGYRELNNSGTPTTAMRLLEALLTRVEGSASGRLLFRIKANIGSCYLRLGDEQKAGDLLAEAYEHAREEPKAIANKAFALLLQGRPLDALAFAKSALADDPSNDQVAGVLVQSARFDDLLDDPLVLVPSTLHQASAVMIAHVEFLRRRDKQEWRAAARALRVAHPDERYAIQFSAEAELDEILNNEALQRTRLFKPGDRARLKRAADDLRSLLDFNHESEESFGAEEAALCGNLVVALFEIGDFPSALDAVKDGLKRAPDDTELLKRAAVVAIETGDEELARRVLDTLPASPDRTILAFRFYSDHNEWKALADLASDQGNIPTIERTLVETVGRIAVLKEEGGDSLACALGDIAEAVVQDPRASVVVADFARMEGLEDVSERAFAAARAAIGTESHIAARTMVAMHAARRGLWRIVADLLDGHINEDRDSPELRKLAMAFVNDSPIRQRAVDFFDRLDPLIRGESFYLHSEGVMSFNRGALGQAETLLRKSVEVEPNLTNYLALFSTLRRRGKGKTIRPLIEALDLTVVEGTPGQKMYLAQQMRASGLRREAVGFAYKVLEAAPNDPDAALRYFRLLMMNPGDHLIPASKTVAVDTWIQLSGSDGQTYSFLIEEGDNRPGENILSPVHPMAAAALGLKVKDSFSLKNGLGDPIEWQVGEIKHKYLHALHVMMANFEHRFPDVKGFYSIKMREGDVQPALEQVKRLSKSNENFADFYVKHHLPMAALASVMGRDTIGLADYIRSLGHNLAVCIGNDPERHQAREFIVARRAGGAVLDTYTAWTAATTDTFDILIDVFGKLVVAQSTIDEIRALVEADKQLGSGRSMTVAYQNGQFIRQELTAADRASRRTFIGEQLKRIESSCEVLAAVAPNDPTELATTLTDNFGTDVLDAVNIAKQGYVLLSEDLYYRQVAQDAAGVSGVWLQSVFAFARDSKILDAQRYADLAVKMAWRRHSHVSIEAGVLVDALQGDTSPDLVNFRALARYIGTKDAEMRSHVSVVIDFLNQIWTAEAKVSLRAMAATGILLEQLVRFRPEDWNIPLGLISYQAVPELAKYIRGWASGHFLSAEALTSAEREVTRMSSRAEMQHFIRRCRGALSTTRWPR